MSRSPGRGERLEEALTILTGLLSGEPVDFEGVHHTVHSPAFVPGPVNGSIPIWVGGHWPNRAPFERAARYDGVVPRKAGEATGLITADDLAAIRGAVGRDDADYAYVASGSTASPDDTEALSAWEAAGATWWLESLHPFGGRADDMRARLRAAARPTAAAGPLTAARRRPAPGSSRLGAPASAGSMMHAWLTHSSTRSRSGR